MKLQVRYSDKSQEWLDIPEDLEMLMFVVGGYPKSLPYGNGQVLVYSDEANKKKLNAKYKGKQLYGAIALMKEADYERIIHG